MRITHTEFIEDVGKVQFYAKIWQEDTGIGDYEFQGQKGHDSSIETQCGNIKWNRDFYTPEENDLIEAHLSKEESVIKEGIISA